MFLWVSFDFEREKEIFPVTNFLADSLLQHLRPYFRCHTNAYVLYSRSSKRAEVIIPNIFPVDLSSPGALTGV